MSIESRSKQYGSIFGDWHIGRLLGTGSNGKSMVFSLYRDNNGWRETCALKVISLIEERGNWDTTPLSRVNEYNTAVREQQAQADQEVQLMSQIRGKTNIVDYLDHKFFRWSDETGFGVDLLIRMELLTDLRGQLKKGTLYSEDEIIRIGRDICQALVICHSKNILHRDIKPENIFFNADGDYKLGDFGVSRILSKTASSLASTGIGTAAYSAPEQFQGGYDHRVDIYSLGLVLYELCNENKLPFAQSCYISQSEIQTRLSGKPLPPLAKERRGNPYLTVSADCEDHTVIGLELERIILKACSFERENRYNTAAEMLADLDQLVGKTGEIAKPGIVHTQSDRQDTKPTHKEDYCAEFVKVNPRSGERKKRIPLLKYIAAVLIPVAVVAAMLPIFRHHHTWTAANCAEPKTCTDCGETEGTALGHNWSAADCTTPKTCENCGETEGYALDHTWLAATYHAPVTCAACGKTEGRSLGYPLTWYPAALTSNETESSSDVDIGTWVDKTGTAYVNSIKFWVMESYGMSDTEYIDYVLSEAYNELSLTIAAEQGSAENTSSKILVYADSILIYESEWVDNNTLPVQTTLDISNRRQLHIVCTTDSQSSCYSIVSALLYK